MNQLQQHINELIIESCMDAGYSEAEAEKMAKDDGLTATAFDTYDYCSECGPSISLSVESMDAVYFGASQ